MIISKKEEFLKVESFVKTIFEVEKNFPAQVFKKRFSNFTFEEFNWTEDPGFWDTSIKILGQTFEDTHIIVMIIDSDLQGYYFNNFDFYTAMKMPLTFAGQDYWKELHTGPREALKDDPYTCADKVVWIPTSGKWAIWGQRSYEACVLAFADESFVIPDESLKATWRPINRALTEFIHLSYRNQQIPQEDSVAFLSNYSNNPTKSI